MVHRILAALAVAALSACGGGGGDTTPAGTTALAATDSPALASSTPTVASSPSQTALAAFPPEAVNTATAGRQFVRSVDALAGGGYAVAWRSEDGAGNAALLVQRYDARGARVGGESRIAYAFGAHENPAIAVLRDGTVVVAAVQVRSDWTVFARRFDANGTPLGNETVVATLSQDAAGASVQHSLAQPVVTALADGGFTLGWASVADDGGGAVFAQHAQRFDAAALAVGPPVDFAAAGIDRNLSLHLVALPGGGFIAGTTHRFNGIGYVQFRIGATDVGPLFDADNGLLELNTTLLPLADGRMALWSTRSTGGYLQMLDASGRALGTATMLPVIPETAANLSDGGWATVTRQMPGEPFLAQRFDAAGRALGSRIELATAVSRPLGLATTGSGFAMGWTAAVASGDTDVMTQRVDAP